MRFGAKYINGCNVDEINLVFQPNKEFYSIVLCLVMNVQRLLHIPALCHIKNSKNQIHTNCKSFGMSNHSIPFAKLVDEY